jgi:competence protein ComEC
MLSKIPSLKLFLPFVLGIALWQIFGSFLTFTLAGILFVIAVIGMFVFQHATHYFQYTFSWINGVFVFVMVCLSGYTICALRQVHHHPLHYSKYLTDSSVVTAIIKEPIIAKPNSFKTVLQITSIKNNGISKQVIGDAYGYFIKTKEEPNLLPGDVIAIQASAIKLRANGNPGEFDYATYSARSGITHSYFINPFRYIKLPKRVPSVSIFFAVQKIKCLAILAKYITNPKAQGIAEALLVGDRSNIEDQVWEAYKNTGIVHIIAISGMHLGLIYFQLVRVLLWIPIFKKNKKTTTMLAIMLMWAFSCLIGMPPSVARAGVIFTIIGVGQMINRKNYTYNSLLFSAFILLVIQPNWILDVGFLLSYAAIFGILLFAQQIQNSIYHPNKIWQKMTKDIATTIAAQIFTLPICLYFFHQFPVLLLVSNLMAIVATTYILYAEILLLILHFLGLSFLCNYLGQLIGWCIVWLNKCVVFLGKIPWFNIQHIQISFVQYIILFVMIICLSIAILRKKSVALLVASFCFILFWSCSIYYQKNVVTQQVLLVHQASKKSIVQLITGKQCKIISQDSITSADVKNILEPARLVYYANNVLPNSTIRNKGYLVNCIHQKTIMQVYANVSAINDIDSIDYLILQRNAKIDIKNIVTQLHPKQLIIDGSNSLWKIEQWKTALATVSLPCHITATQGAFIAKL